MIKKMVFQNREEAGRQLAARLLKLKYENLYVLAIPRGGLPVGYEIAKLLQAHLSVIVVRKIGLSGNKEFGIGAIAEGGVRVLDQTTIEAIGIDENEIKDTIELEEKELERRVDVYRQGKLLPDLTGRTAVLVDDGMATGITVRAAIAGVRKLNPKKIVLATPVCALDTAKSLRNEVDEFICLASPAEFMAVGLWYRNFTQVSDEEVIEILKKAEEFKK